MEALILMATVQGLGSRGWGLGLGMEALIFMATV